MNWQYRYKYASPLQCPFRPRKCPHYKLIHTKVSALLSCKSISESVRIDRKLHQRQQKQGSRLVVAQGGLWKVSALSSRSQKNGSESRLWMSCAKALLLSGFQRPQFQDRDRGNRCEARSAWLGAICLLGAAGLRGRFRVCVFQVRTVAR